MDLGHILGILIAIGVVCVVTAYLLPPAAKIWGYLVAAVIAIWLIVLPLLHVNVH